MLKTIITFILSGIGRKFINDNLPSLHWRNITTNVVIAVFVLWCWINKDHIQSAALKILRLHKIGFIRLSSKVAFMVAICGIMSVILKKLQVRFENQKPLLLLPPGKNTDQG